MTIAIATPTGNTGALIAQQLIEAGADVSVLVRDPNKLSDVIRRHAAVSQGSRTYALAPGTQVPGCSAVS